MEKKYVYIKKSIGKTYVEFDKPLSPEEYNNLGSTWQDYLNNLWVQLSDEQIEFHNTNPNATVKEVFDMAITPSPARTLEQAKIEKKHIIDIYNNSDAINSFTIDFGNGVTQDAWLTPDKRANYKNSIDSAELLGISEVHPVFNGQQLTLPIQTAKRYLAQIQIYADSCYITTEMHKANVQALDSIEAVDAYDHTTGYHAKLIFPA